MNIDTLDPEELGAENLSEFPIYMEENTPVYYSEGPNGLPTKMDDKPNDLPTKMDDILLLKESVPSSDPDEIALQPMPSTMTGLNKALWVHAHMMGKFWPDVNQAVMIGFEDFADTYKNIRATKAPNFITACIPVSSDLICSEWDARLAQYHDRQLCDFIKYGWPLGYIKEAPPVTSLDNHSSAKKHIDQVNKFIQKELECNAIISPLSENPFQPWIMIPDNDKT